MLPTDATTGQDASDEPLGDEIPHSLWKALGITEPRIREDLVGPAVDEGLLRRLVRRELSMSEQRAVYRLIDAFRSWSDAHAEVLASEFRRTKHDA